MAPAAFWLLFHAAVGGLIGLDLWLGLRRGERMAPREAAGWVALWIASGVGVGYAVSRLSGPGGALLYFSAYAVEYLLSVDNLFVFAAIFQAFRTPPEARPLALYAGIAGAIAMRASFIYGGLLLLEAFSWALFLLGALLVYSGASLWRGREERGDEGRVTGALRRLLPLAPDYSGRRLWVRRGGRLELTPLFLVIATLEATDFVFALDSVPAVLVLTEDFLIAYTSNVMAVVGLRSLYSLVELALLGLPGFDRVLAFVLILLGAATFAEGLGLPLSPYALAALTLASLFAGLLLALLRRRGRSLERYS
jgi:tellurite resistance protein TerC